MEKIDKSRLPLYCNSLFQFSRNRVVDVVVGNILIGGYNPVRIQTMTTSSTMDIEATSQQIVDCIKAGAELVRVTAQGEKEAYALADIKERVEQLGYTIPLVADIHFNPKVAFVAAGIVDKVRINPGNFADGAKNFKEVTEDQYNRGAEVIREKFIPFLKECKKNNTSIRLGVNHGSLSDRIMSKYGDTPDGMAESCMEYLRICKEEGFSNVVISIKSSNTRIMVHTVRLLNALMKSEQIRFPLHLGVTEAGAGEDGRIKSAVGIGALMSDGIGDTIRVSLTESPENEMPVARQLKEHIEDISCSSTSAEEEDAALFSPFDYQKRLTTCTGMFGGDTSAAVVLDLRGRECKQTISNDLVPDAVIIDSYDKNTISSYKNSKKIVPAELLDYFYSEKDSVTPLYKQESICSSQAGEKVVEVNCENVDSKLLEFLKRDLDTVILLSSSNSNKLAAFRSFFLKLLNNRLPHPVIISAKYNTFNIDEVAVKAAVDLGGLFIDGFGDGLSIAHKGDELSRLCSLHFGILQASRVRFSKTEYISCPGCGRTLFDLESTLKEVQKRTSHLKGLKIAVMGCIVNGIGEMADADYGYVGAGRSKISLFKNRKLVKKNIPEKEAVDSLVELLKENGDWVNPL
ncbi:(E)-4-hydroxy-3-methylbut-2-enyl-diphosphate synthase [Marinilabiliaceae bacterium ANBcel2]|nr:(E)-4-hydroxy-3-methylbut-2-enyl-diphosphate synthase [Marinilabiliaceae bacterium ANBcel2]